MFLKLSNSLWVREPHKELSHIVFNCFPFLAPIKHQLEVSF
uniref:Uncharacterized protein n=1 Tax=Arundo donax TaxID=35708 RepID=A0A0A9HRP7_ARUDO